MAGIILDFDGQEFNTLRDIVLLIRECVVTNDSERAVAFRDALRVATTGADMTLAMACGWAYRSDVTKAADAMQLFGVTNTASFGAKAPADVIKPVWEAAADTTPIPPAPLGEQIQKGIAEAQAIADGEQDPA